MNLHDWLRHCEQLHPQTIDMGLERVTQVAQALKLSMPCPVITVAGTNGKGSTCAMLESVLRHAGYKTGLYTSPHLVHFEERCRLQGRPAQAAQLLPYFDNLSDENPAMGWRAIRIALDRPAMLRQQMRALSIAKDF